MRVLFISICAVVILFVALLMTRLWGVGQQYPDFQHPFFDGAKPLVIVKAVSEPQMSEDLKLKSDIAFWLDVETTHDQKLIVFARDFSEKEMSVEAFRGPKSLAYPLSHLKNIRPEIMELREILTKYPQQKFVINILDNVENVHKWTVDALKGLEPEKRILLQSNYNVIMTSIKELEAFWLYGCSQADLMRFMTFDSMWILPAAPFKGDVYIAPKNLLGRPSFNDDIITEVRRRNKKIVLGPLKNQEDFDYATRLNVDGIIVENLSEFLKSSRP